MMEAMMYRTKWSTMTIILFSIACQCLSQPFQHNISTKATSIRPSIFSPRMDYDEWTPLGRGDPLKNDPTFDYVPPVLDRVQYWLDSQSSTEPSSKRDILVLGVTAKKTSPKIPNNFLKFFDGSKFMRPHHHHYHHQQQQQQQDNEENYRKSFMGSAGAEPPNIIRATNFRNGGGISSIGTNSLDLRHQNQIQNIPASYYPSPYYDEKSKPYTMMMPPPIQQSNIRHHQFGMQTEEAPTSILLDMNEENRDAHINPVGPRPLHSQSSSNTNEQSTSSSITFDKSNLIYQSSQTFDRWEPAINNNNNNNNNNKSEKSAIWNANDNIKSYDHYGDDHNVAASANHEVVIGQNANIIVDGDIGDNEQVVLGRKEVAPPLKNKLHDDANNYDYIRDNNSSQTVVTKMHIVLANSSSSTLSDDKLKKVTVALVMPSNYVEIETDLKKSQKFTTIDSTTLASMKLSPSRQYSTISTLLARVTPKFSAPIPTRNSETNLVQIKQTNQLDYNLSTTLTPTMTMPENNFMSSVVSISAKDQQNPNIDEDTMQQSMTTPEKMMRDQSQLAIILNGQKITKMTTNSLNLKPILMSTTTSAAPTITSSSITSSTDSILSHYKQPSESINAPMYLIIQGHSKVKTYKPIVNKYGIPVENNLIDIETTTKRFISKFEKFVNDNTRVVHSTRRSVVENNHEVKAKEKRVEQHSLLSLVESGLSAFTASPSPPPPSSSSSSPESPHLSLFE